MQLNVRGGMMQRDTAIVMIYISVICMSLKTRVPHCISIGDIFELTYRFQVGHTVKLTRIILPWA